MPYELGVTEVGEAEFPLIEVLRDTIFGEFGHRSHTPIAESLSDRVDRLVLIAHLEGNPVGFSAGFRRAPGGYYINYIAVLRDYRRQGIGRRFLQWHEEFARSRNYRQIEFNTFNHFPDMLRLGLLSGYRPIGIEQHHGTGNDLAIRFGKSLQVGSAAQPPDANADADLLQALAAGKKIIGMERTPAGELRVLLS
jgi:GNAT superfamily N-acetyltransferase